MNQFGEIILALKENCFDGLSHCLRVKLKRNLDLRNDFKHPSFGVVILHYEQRVLEHVVDLLTATISRVREVVKVGSGAYIFVSLRSIYTRSKQWRKNETCKTRIIYIRKTSFYLTIIETFFVTLKQHFFCHSI